MACSSINYAQTSLVNLLNNAAMASISEQSILLGYNSIILQIISA